MVLTMALGGAIWGVFFGIGIGAAGGAIQGFWVDDLSWVLDGVLIGGVSLAVVGALFGAALELSTFCCRTVSPSETTAGGANESANPRSPADAPHPPSGPHLEQSLDLHRDASRQG
ncbi:MAG: hypothetical protein ACK4RK_09735 [Gemmataceae bacterium]